MTSVARSISDTDPDEPPDGGESQDVVLIARTDDPQTSPATNPGRTLLPAPVAQAVSFATRSTSLALRVGTVLGSFGLGAAKATTLSSLELGRGILEGILSRAGKDVIARSGGELGRADAESVLEKSLESLHHAMTQVVFWTTTGFQLTSTSLGMISDVSQLLLSSLDQFFGSTDSSRAIASIITLIRREFRNPATGVPGERVGVVDLVMGLCGLAYLQQWCHRLVEEENRRLRIDEMVWDVVVLNTGARIDVHGDSLQQSRLLATEGDGSIAGTIKKSTAVQDDDGSDIERAEMQLQQQIMESLPAGASVSLSTAVSTTKTITVDITGLQIPYIDPPPGFELVEFEALPGRVASSALLEDGSSAELTDAATHDRVDAAPVYRVVYRLRRTRGTTTHLRREDDFAQSTGLIEQTPEDDVEVVARADDPPERPPIPPREKSIGAQTSKTPSNATANQKRTRMPPSTPSSAAPPPPPPKQRRVASGSEKTAAKNASTPPMPPPPPRPAAPEKKPLFRNPLRKGSSAAGKNVIRKDANIPARGHSAVKHLNVPSQRPSTPVAARVPPRSPVNKELYPRSSSSRAGYVAVHQTRRDSLVSQTDTYSLHSTDPDRPLSPTFTRTESRAGGSIVKSKSEKELPDVQLLSPTKNRRHARGHTHTPSIHTLRTKASESSLVPYAYHNRGIYDDAEALDTLRHSGMVAGIFPRCHLLRNLDRYMRFASASYGSSFLKFMKIGREMPILRALDDTHHELRSFAYHTQSDTDSILLSSFVDPQGGSDSTGSTNTGVPMVHYISLDHESKAVVLACRGTLGFEDVLADMTCDYDDLVWRGSTYKVHKGIHASARRLLYGGDGRVLLTLRHALEEFEDYGVVLTGHSLGGAVTALLGVMLSEPASTGASFVTSSSLENHRLLPSPSSPSTDSSSTSPPPTPPSPPLISLPAGRPIHVYAYGPPATMSTSLRRATRGLITSVVNGHDLVPYLSLGVLHDLQAVALAFKTDNSDAKSEVRRRVWEAFQTGIANKWYAEPGAAAGARRRFMPGSEDDGEEWAWAALKVLRASMMSRKLVPPGEVFAVESSAVLRRDAFVGGGGNGGGGGGEEEEPLGKPARRVVLKYVRDVEGRFREVRFGTGMLTDHSPGKYEDSLRRLRWGVMEGYR
ncbi:Sn1-specific diacylglycerol lipase alpha [Coniochaeta hoffmannii]|uniref:sn-1-specific diacylglycerol lipase n=1 Tax=Coniochaeta hoffmannii TaxID=91930 RepID=A0AA38VMN5_9PEZI|nr:Sn1-specific diacylglycerol lipase alpha [Coniochaeta hoffmannii]